MSEQYMPLLWEFSGVANQQAGLGGWRGAFPLWAVSVWPPVIATVAGCMTQHVGLLTVPKQQLRGCWGS